MNLHACLSSGEWLKTSKPLVITININQSDFLLLLANTLCERFQSQQRIHHLALSQLRQKKMSKFQRFHFHKTSQPPLLGSAASLQPVPPPRVAPVHVALDPHRGCWSSAFLGPQRCQSNTRLYELHHSPARRPNNGCGKGMSGSAFPT